MVISPKNHYEFVGTGSKTVKSIHSYVVKTILAIKMLHSGKKSRTQKPLIP